MIRALLVIKLIKKIKHIKIHELNMSDTIYVQYMPCNSSKETEDSNNETKITLIDTVI